MNTSNETDSGGDVNLESLTPLTPPPPPSSSEARDSTMDLGHEKSTTTTETRVRQFMNILEQLPRLCSPTICGTLSQPTTRSERASRGADLFEWSIEQKAILSPANITEDWQNVAVDLEPAWRKQESDMFFSQKTIAPSPLVVDNRAFNRLAQSDDDEEMMQTSQERIIYDEDDEDEEEEEEDDDDNNHDADDDQIITDEDDRIEYVDDDDDDEPISEDEDDDDDDKDDDSLTEIESEHQDEFDDDLLFSPAPVRSSQKMDVFSPATFSRVMEDEHTLQSTPKTTRTRGDYLD